MTSVRDLNIPELAQALDEMRQGKEGFATYTFGGEEAVAAYGSLTGSGPYGGNGWSIVTKTPTAEIYKDVYTLRTYLFALVAVASIAAAGIALVVTSSVVRPLVAVANAAAAVADGRPLGRYP
jgi:hypothetical protein